MSGEAPAEAATKFFQIASGTTPRRQWHCLSDNTRDVGVEARYIDSTNPSTYAAIEWLSTDLSVEGKIVSAQSEEELVGKLTILVRQVTVQLLLRYHIYWSTYFYVLN